MAKITPEIISAACQKIGITDLQSQSLMCEIASQLEDFSAVGGRGRSMTFEVILKTAKARIQDLEHREQIAAKAYRDLEKKLATEIAKNKRT